MTLNISIHVRSYSNELISYNDKILTNLPSVQVIKIGKTMKSRSKEF